MNYSEQIAHLVIDRPHPMAVDLDSLVWSSADRHHAGSHMAATRSAPTHRATALRPASLLDQADAVTPVTAPVMGPWGLFVRGSTAGWLRVFQNHGLDHIKMAVVDCIAMAGCVLCAALLTLLLGM